MAMDRNSTTLCAVLVLLATSAGAETLIEPGQWKVTSMTRINGATSPAQVTTRCLGKEQVADLSKTFGPQTGTVNSTCEPAQFDASGRTLKWRLQCKGQLDMAVAGDFSFDTPTRYTATVASKGWMAGRLISDVTTELQGERVGDCGQ